VRSEKHRRAVAGLPCVHCGIEGYSQAAHANTGKGMGMKSCDFDTFPLCADRPGVRGCHSQFDQGALFSKHERREVEQRWIAHTRASLAMQPEIPETWVPVVGFESLYEVSDGGRVRSLARPVKTSRGVGQRLVRGRILSPSSDKDDYRQVGLHKDGQRYTAKVHALVARAFIGPRPDGAQIAHGDGRRTNNALGNLRYASVKENIADKLAHGTANRGESSSGAKLTAETVRLIRAAPGMHKHVAALFGVPRSTVSMIKARLSWAHLE